MTDAAVSATLLSGYRRFQVTSEAAASATLPSGYGSDHLLG
jgi:hypothetical protein